MSGAHHTSAQEEQLDRERYTLLRKLERTLEVPMLALGIVWLVLLVFELLNAARPWMTRAGTVIWILFAVDFCLKLLVAPDKLRYLRKNWLTLLALILPALRIFRIFRIARILRAARAARSFRLVRILSSLNRGMGALGKTLRRRRLGYVIALTVLVTVTGAAGMYAFENGVADPRALHDYGTALWWTAMVITTMGTEYWPQTSEGRVLCFFLALYGFAVFGYLTATLATFFIGQDAKAPEAGPATAQALESLRREMAALRRELPPPTE